MEITREGTFKARRQLTPFAPDLKAFSEQLAVLDRNLTGEAVLAHLEDEFEARITLKNGKGTLAGHVRDPIGSALHFDEIPIDQSYVREALEQFDALTRRSPCEATRLTPS